MKAACTPPLEHCPERSFSVADFHQLGQRNAFGYRFPQLDAALERKGCDPAHCCVAKGRVLECAIRPGLCLVLSDIDVLQPYQSTSQVHSEFAVCFLLQGQADVRLHTREEQTLRLQPSLAMSAQYGEGAAISGLHAAGQRLCSVSVALTDAHALQEDSALAACAHLAACHTSRPQVRAWRTNTHVRQIVSGLLQPPWHGPLQKLYMEGATLQLLACGLGHWVQGQAQGQGPDLPATAARAGGSPTARDMRRLEQVRTLLHEQPEQAHSLHALARLACMSVSTLGLKFAQAYGCSVFQYLRKRRLELAREQLQQGISVAQAAASAGYRHPASFSAAFRAHFGHSPTSACKRAWVDSLPCRA